MLYLETQKGRKLSFVPGSQPANYRVSKVIFHEVKSGWKLELVTCLFHWMLQNAKCLKSRRTLVIRHRNMYALSIASCLLTVECDFSGCIWSFSGTTCRVLSQDKEKERFIQIIFQEHYHEVQLYIPQIPLKTISKVLEIRKRNW
jgi:hypothetical protein